MNIPTKKLQNGFEIPVLGLGTWRIGGDKLRNPDNDDAADIKAIRQAIEAGISHIDTAEDYAEGHTEELIGEAIQGFDRSKLFLVSMVKSTHLAYKDVLNSCHNSLKRLKTDYLDLYLIHSPSDEIPIEETMKAMDSLVKDGLVKNIGVSNFKTNRLIMAQKCTENKIVTNQVYYNLVIREPEHEGLLDYCQKNDVFLIAYRPLEKGVLLKEVPPVIEKLMKKYDKSFAQIALNWLISQDSVVTISKMSNMEHLKENLGAIGWSLDREDVEVLRKTFPNQQVRPENLPLR